jgi:hypothetical protein
MPSADHRICGPRLSPAGWPCRPSKEERLKPQKREFALLAPAQRPCFIIFPAMRRLLALGDSFIDTSPTRKMSNFASIADGNMYRMPNTATRRVYRRSALALPMPPDVGLGDFTQGVGDFPRRSLRGRRRYSARLTPFLIPRPLPFPLVVGGRPALCRTSNSITRAPPGV